MHDVDVLHRAFLLLRRQLLELSGALDDLAAEEVPVFDGFVSHQLIDGDVEGFGDPHDNGGRGVLDDRFVKADHARRDVRHFGELSLREPPELADVGEAFGEEGSGLGFSRHRVCLPFQGFHYYAAWIP